MATEVDLGTLDDMDHEAKYDTDAEYRKSELRIQALGAAISRRDLHAVEQAYAAIRDKFYSHGRRLPTGFGWINSATEKGSSSQLGPQQEMCDRAAIVVARMGHWVPEEKRSELAAHIRIALDTEVEAGGPYLNNGWNKPVAITSGDHQ